MRNHQFFPDSKPKEGVYTLKKSDIAREDIAKMLADIRKNIVTPLEILNVNRPGHEANGKALQESLKLYEGIQQVLDAPEENMTHDDTSPAFGS